MSIWSISRNISLSLLKIGAWFKVEQFYAGCFDFYLDVDLADVYSRSEKKTH